MDAKQIYTDFLVNIENHVLTVNFDNGLFRDISFENPYTKSMHVNITTRAGYLFYTGDMGAFTFSRIPDMFDFFRVENGNIQPRYWSEKLVSVDRFGGSEEFSEKIAQKHVDDYLEGFLSYLDLNDEDDLKKATLAKQAISEFKGCLDSYESMAEAYSDWRAEEAGGMELCDFMYEEFKQPTYRLIWCLYAIVHVINLYDKQKNEGLAPEKTTAS